jgi:hypothetical protein
MTSTCGIVMNYRDVTDRLDTERPVLGGTVGVPQQPRLDHDQL